MRIVVFTVTAVWMAACGGAADELANTPADSSEPPVLVATEPDNTPKRALKYRPPAGFESFVVYNVPTSGDVALRYDTDYRLVWPPAGRDVPVRISGGRNIVIIGGRQGADGTGGTALVRFD